MQSTRGQREVTKVQSIQLRLKQADEAFARLEGKAAWVSDHPAPAIAELPFRGMLFNAVDHINDSRDPAEIDLGRDMHAVLLLDYCNLFRG